MKTEQRSIWDSYEEVMPLLSSLMLWLEHNETKTIHLRTGLNSLSLKIEDQETGEVQVFSITTGRQDDYQKLYSECVGTTEY